MGSARDETIGLSHSQKYEFEKRNMQREGGRQAGMLVCEWVKVMVENLWSGDKIKRVFRAPVTTRRV